MPKKLLPPAAVAASTAPAVLAPIVANGEKLDPYPPIVPPKSTPTLGILPEVSPVIPPDIPGVKELPLPR